MKTVVNTPTADIAVRTLPAEGVRQVHSWFDHLANWDGDEHVRKMSPEVAGHPGVRVLRTSSDYRIFFRIDGDKITILDIAKTPAIIASGGPSGAR
jgi:mRNA-degrading endonuclease RelE of RelBE toxin-antitoxin system